MIKKVILRFKKKVRDVEKNFEVQEERGQGDGETQQREEFLITLHMPNTKAPTSCTRIGLKQV